MPVASCDDLNARISIYWEMQERLRIYIQTQRKPTYFRLMAEGAVLELMSHEGIWNVRFAHHG